MPERDVAAAPASWRFEIAPGAKAAVDAWGLTTAPLAGIAAGRPLGRNDGREVRVLSDPAGARPTLYLKWFARARRCDREASRLSRLKARGARVPELLARGRSQSDAALLVLGELEGRPLDEWLAGADASRRRAAGDRLGAALAALHARGAAHRQLFAWHVIVAADGSIGWIDVAEATVRSSPLKIGERAADLASLFASVARRAWTLAERARMLRAYEPERGRRRLLAAAIRRERVRLLRRARVPRDWPHREWRTQEQRLLVAEEFAEAVARLGRTDVASWLAPPEAVVVRTRDGRSNLRWRPPLGTSGETWFGKRFERAPWRGRAPAFREFVAFRALASIGVPVPPIVAVGRKEGGASVVWTRGVVPGTSLRELLPTLAPRGGRGDERKLLLGEAARIARTLHAAGFCHRDLYLDHFLVEERAGRRRLVLIDATRVAAFARLPRRWRTKDVAALEFSARGAGATRSERWRALLEYARGDRRLARRLARAAVRKADAIARRERSHLRAAPSA